LANGTTRQATALASFIKIIDRLTNLARDMEPAPLVREMLQHSGYVDMLAEEDSKEARERLARLQELVARAHAASSMDGLTAIDRLQAWMDTVTLIAQADDEAEHGKVALMTVHNSKGLEYPVIFVVHMMEGSFPHSRSLDTAMGIEEERRLAYVAFTRAQEQLVISYSDSLPTQGKHRHGTTARPSRFLFSAPPEVCAGKLPTASSNDPQEGGNPRAMQRSNMREFLRNHKTGVEADYAVYRDVERLEQLQPGTRVHHPRHGLGTVRNLYGSGPGGKLLVTFDSKRTLPVPLISCPLRLVFEEERADAETTSDAT